MNLATSRYEPHYRLTPEDARQYWRSGLYNAATYLHHLLSAMKAQGWKISIKSIDEFCAEWEIKKRTFYAAKAKLELLGLIEEDAPNGIDITVLPIDADSCTTSARSCTENADSCTTSARSCTENADSCTTSARSCKIDPQNPIEINSFGDSPDLYQISIRSLSDLSHSDRGKKTERPQIAKRDRNAYSEQFENWWNGYRDLCVLTDHKPGSKREAWKEWSKNESFFCDQHFQECDQIYRAREIARLRTGGRVYGIKHGCRYLRSDEWENAYYAHSRSAEVGVDFSDPTSVRQAANQADRQRLIERLEAMGVAG